MAGGTDVSPTSLIHSFKSMGFPAPGKSQIFPEAFCTVARSGFLGWGDEPPPGPLDHRLCGDSCSLSVGISETEGISHLLLLAGPGLHPDGVLPSGKEELERTSLYPQARFPPPWPSSLSASHRNSTPGKGKKRAQEPPSSVLIHWQEPSSLHHPMSPQ